jgi:flagellar biosynthetic protein FliQ
MNSDTVISLATQAMDVAFKVAMPLLLAGLVVGLIVSVFQAVTQIQEQTLAFIPKIIAIAAVLVIAGPWMLGQVLTYTSSLYNSIPGLVGQ